MSGKPSATRYANLVKLCLEVTTDAFEDDDKSVDMTQELNAMNSIYIKTKAQLVLETTHTQVDNTKTGRSENVLSPRVVRGK